MPDSDVRLASAILQLANGLSGDERWEQHADAARELVRDLAFPDHAEKPSPAPAPSCDAPHCDCDTGEDCKANAAAEAVQPAWTLCRVDCDRVGTVLRLSDGRRVMEFGIPDGLSYDGMKDALHVLSDRLHDGKPTAPPAADLGARLDGLKAAVDALAGRLDGKARERRERVRYVYPTSILPASGQGLVWVISTQVAAHACGFEVGDRVAREDVASDTMIVTGIASHGTGPLIGLTVRKAEG